MAELKVNNIGIDSIARTHYGTRFRIGFTVDDGHGEDDQVGSHVLIDLPNNEADPMMRELTGKLGSRVSKAIEAHLQEGIWVTK